MTDGATPLVSVVVPVFNGADYVRTAVESALTQSHQKVEVIVVDNASTDGTLDRLAGMQDVRLRIEQHTRHVSMAENFNRAVAASGGAFTKILCADDLLYPTCIAAQVEAFATHGPSAVFSIVGRDVVSPVGRRLVTRRPSLPMGLWPGRELIRRCAISGSNQFGEPAAVLFRTDALKASGGFSTACPYTLDLELYCRLAADAMVLVDPAPRCAFRVHRRSASVSLAGMQARAFRRLTADLSRRGVLQLTWTQRIASRLRGSANALARQALYRIATEKALPAAPKPPAPC